MTELPLKRVYIDLNSELVYKLTQLAIQKNIPRKTLIEIILNEYEENSK